MLNSNSWHVRLYLWTILGWKHLFTSCATFEGTREWYEGNSCWTSTNTCTYLRTLLLWCPLLHLIYASLILGPFIAVFEPLIRKFGLGGLAYTLGIGGAAVLIMVALFFIGKLVFKLLDVTFGTIASGVNYAIERCQQPEVGFCTMIMKCLRDWHNKVCTKFEITDRSAS